VIENDRNFDGEETAAAGAMMYAGKLSLPMTVRLLAKSIMKHIAGAAVTPLMSAAQTSALMGSGRTASITDKE
jgi:hypothetical protein